MELDLIDISKPEERTRVKRQQPNKSAVRAKKIERNSDEQSRVQSDLAKQRQRVLNRKRRERKIRMIKRIIIGCEFVLIILFCVLLYHIIRGFAGAGRFAEVFHTEENALIRENQSPKPMVTENFLTVNRYSRPGIELEKVNNIFVHYTANQGTSAAQNRSYFENLGITGETSASAHFIIGYEGEIIQCLPLNEIGYAVKQRNYDSISIECCYLSADGEFTEETYQSLVQLSAWLLREYKLAPEDMKRHYDEGGKKCPLYYVENEGEWEQFLQDLENYILNSNGAAEETAALLMLCATISDCSC